MSGVIPTDTLRSQHANILRAARALQALLEPGTHDVAHRSQACIQSLATELSGHLALEDGTVYPALAAHADASVRALATRLQDEMGSLSAVFDSYRREWSGAAAIDARMPAFIHETRGLLDALARRVALEDQQLYPLVDRPI